MMRIVILDAATLGSDTDLSPLMEQGDVTVWDNTPPELVGQRIRDTDVIVSNKVKLTGQLLQNAQHLKLICLSATGFDCVDTAYCAANGIGVCNVPGYSTHSVAQLTVAMVLELVNHLCLPGICSQRKLQPQRRCQCPDACMARTVR